MSARHRWLMLAAVGLVILAVCSLVVADGTVSQPERDVFLWINRWPDWLDAPLWIFQQAGNLVVATLLTVAVGIGVRNRRLVSSALLVAAAKLITERIVKVMVERPRPGVSIGSEAVLRNDVPASGLSFVSGHSTITTAMAVLLTATLPKRWRPLPWACVILNAIGRVHDGAHNPLDIAGGVGLGLAIGGATVALLLVRDRPKVR